MWIESVKNGFRLRARCGIMLNGLPDEQLKVQLLQGEDEDLRVWQVLVHVVNHGTDHRAQILRILHELGVKTQSQDFIFTFMSIHHKTWGEVSAFNRNCQSIGH